ncbi:hypothetical protein G6K88_22020 [Agrobacterium rhizogenes]|uniref:hypothetical protein n=1 Tax=Rhizobium rhizogenes TaxID=359 RepID=UPI001574226C|nr:hypothetical protein [Rhizobium rhizogenes]NTH66582.1 hypothetical protein [Rhizobium rhizogenes]NTI04704.1 hypothetical protein [Rhizobium rhizogenes]NTI11513.1 hypothetical protein [Rhizobium rhizogenes]
MSAATWQCALCGAVNSGETAFCGNCGAASSIVGPTISLRSVAADDQNANAAAVILEKEPTSGDQKIESNLAPPSDNKQRAMPIKLPGRLRAYTGVVTVAERDTKKQTEVQSVYAEQGRVVATHTVDTFTHNIRFRVIVQSGDGHPLQVPVQVGIDRTILFLQDGDLVTLIGYPSKEGLFKDPAILDHAGRFTIIPRRWGPIRTFLMFLLVIACLTIFFASFDITTHVVLGAYYLLNLGHWAAGLVGVVIGFRWVRDWWRQHTLARAARQMTAKFGEGWEKRHYRNPTGTVEGVFAFTRGKQNPVEWISFRLAMTGPDGQTRDWIVAAAPQKRLTTDLRRGDRIELRGRFATGSIQRTRHIALAMS